MGKYAQFVLGPAGSGKSTYCETVEKYCQASGRAIHFANFDPAAEDLNYHASIDIKDLVTVEEIMEELNYGPNGGLVYAIEYLIDNLEWLGDQLGDFDDDYLIIDCPGQIELYTHFPLMKRVSEYLEKAGYKLCSVFLVDVQFITDTSKFISAALMCLSTMLNVETAHINILSKMDLHKKLANKKLTKYLDPDVFELVEDLNDELPNGKHQKLNESIVQILQDYNLVSFLPLDITDDESIQYVLQHIDHAVQFGEDEEVNVPKENDEDEDPVLSDYLQ